MMQCPNCGEVNLWDAVYGHCWTCNYGYVKPYPIWLRILIFPLAILILGMG